MFQPDSAHGLHYDASTELNVIYDCLCRIADSQIVDPDNAVFVCDQLSRVIRHAVSLSNRIEAMFLEQMVEEAARRLENQGEK